MDQHVSLNLNVRGLPQSATLAIRQRVRALHAEGRDVVDLGLGQSPFPVPEHVVQALRDHAHEKDYLPVQGLPALREAIAVRLARSEGIDVAAEQVLVGPGTKELLFLLQLCFYGEIIVPTPSWVSYVPQSVIVGRKVHCVPTLRRHGWKVRPDALAAFLEEQSDRYRPRLLVLNYPSNPTGVTYTDAELRALAAVAREYELIILSDEIYGGLTFDGDHVSIARHYPEGTIVLDGISKWAGAGGWRLGAFTFPPQLAWLKDTMAAVASETYTSVAAPIQYAAVAAFDDEPMQSYLDGARNVLGALLGSAHRTLADAGIGVARPQGGFYLFPDWRPRRSDLAARGIRTGAQLCTALLDEAGVACLPGSAFNRPREEATARLSLVDFDGAAALAALPASGNADDGWLREHCPRVMRGIDAVATWA